MRTVHIVLAALLCSCPLATAEAQSRSASRRSEIAQRDGRRDRTYGDRRPSAASPYASHLVTPRIDAFGSTRNIGVVTRGDRIRAESLHRDFPVGLIEPPPINWSPIAQSLLQRNLLHSRSPLGLRLTALNGRLDPALVPQHADYQPGLHFDPVPAWEGRSYNQVLADGQDRRAGAYYDLAVAAFRESDHFRAQQYLGLARQLRPLDSKVYCAEALVALQAQSVNSALSRLAGALDPERSKSLEDLRVDWRALFPVEQDFKRLVRRWNLGANAPDAGPAAKFILAYLSWLNGDESTAQLSAEAAHAGFLNQQEAEASTDSGEEATGVARSSERFLRLLAESRKPPPQAAP